SNGEITHTIRLVEPSDALLPVREFVVQYDDYRRRFRWLDGKGACTNKCPHRRDPVGAIGPHLRKGVSDEHQHATPTTAGTGCRPHAARSVVGAPRRDPGRGGRAAGRRTPHHRRPPSRDCRRARGGGGMSAELLGPVVLAAAAGIALTMAYLRAAAAVRRVRQRLRRLSRTRVALVVTTNTTNRPIRRRTRR